MSFNQTLFNRGVFNLSQSGNATWLTIEAYENVEALTGVSQNIFLLCIPHEHVDINLHGTPFRAFSALGSEVIGWDVSLEGAYWLDFQFREKIDQKILFSRNLHVSGSGLEETDAKSKIACHRVFFTQGGEDIGLEALGSREYHTEFDGNELVSQASSSITIEVIACEIEVTLQPGQQLIIDASNYNVLLDDENMIHKQKGRWLDELERDTLNISVTAASGQDGLSTTILYTERYL